VPFASGPRSSSHCGLACVGLPSRSTPIKSPGNTSFRRCLNENGRFLALARRVLAARKQVSTVLSFRRTNLRVVVSLRCTGKFLNGRSGRIADDACSDFETYQKSTRKYRATTSKNFFMSPSSIYLITAMRVCCYSTQKACHCNTTAIYQPKLELFPCFRLQGR
jgi:hypothetical protein